MIPFLIYSLCFSGGGLLLPLVALDKIQGTIVKYSSPGIYNMNIRKKKKVKEKLTSIEGLHEWRMHTNT